MNKCEAGVGFTNYNSNQMRLLPKRFLARRTNQKVSALSKALPRQAVITKQAELESAPQPPQADQPFKFRGDVHEKEFSCGFLNAVIILRSKTDIVSKSFRSNIDGLCGPLTRRQQHTYPSRTWRVRRGNISHATHFARPVMGHRSKIHASSAALLTHSSSHAL